MKIRVIGAFSVALIAAVWLTGCKGGGVTASTGMSNLNCSQCHDPNTSSTYGLQVLANEAAYSSSGHSNGTRHFSALPLTNSQVFTVSGSHATSNTSSGCSQCHTNQGFVDWLSSGAPASVEPGVPPGCFTCHNPHETGNFTVRTQSAVTLMDGVTTYDHGAGNLCVNCHHARNAYSPALITGAGPFKLSTNPHHGVQGDVLSGANFASFGNTYQSVSPHATGPVDSCVSCHTFDPTAGNQTKSLQMGNHGLYLTAQVSATSATTTDYVALCSSCHTTGANFRTTHLAAADWDGNGSAQDKLVEIRGLRDRLIVYFYNNVTGAVVAVTGGAIVSFAPGSLTVPSEPSTWEWYKDFTLGGSSVTFTTQAQAQAFWNLELFIEDRSNGIHNPTFLAQILYDSCVAVGAPVGTRPQ